MIIIVDDNPMDRYLLARQLSQVLNNLALSEFDDGDSFLQQFDSLLNTQTPVTVFLDINMPLCDGFEVLSKLNQKPKQHSFRIVIMSSSDHPSDKVKAMQNPLVSHYLVKGQVDVEQLKKIVA